ncbi:hypothetical protein [Sphingopyxis macrogoltabida]|uniref:Uncharacterized protein n=1 Tax=Sphingopyxis macrogoltabida TaxID=33050 RepID=A0AAC9AUP5_SPHMC|nr:hypothetical protein [Sphingopyxis macrogoltabida]AMU88922.1 hypothetical protein ATM17_07680 [Sphingopyxis macrogoltabida]
MSGYWSAIAAAARGGVGGQGDAAPVPSVPIFAPDTSAGEEDWGALDIEAAAPAAIEARKDAPPEKAATADPVAEKPGAVPTPAAPAGAAMPTAFPPAAEASATRDDRLDAGTLPTADERTEPVAVTTAETATVVQQVIPPPSADTPLSMAATVAEPARPEAAFPVTGAESEAGDDEAVPKAPAAEASPVPAIVEALPAALAVGADIAAAEDGLGDPAADLPPPIHIHIDRIDIRLTGDDAVAPRTAPRRVAPVVALDEFLRRPSERNG